GIEELLPRARELVGQLLGFALREEVAFLPLSDVGATTLDEVRGEAVTELLVLITGGGRERCKVGVKEPEQPKVGVLITAVRRRREHHEVTSLLADEPLQKLVTLVAALTGGRAGVRLVDDDQLGARAEELGAAAFALDVVEADDRVRVSREDALARR